MKPHFDKNQFFDNSYTLTQKKKKLLSIKKFCAYNTTSLNSQHYKQYMTIYNQRESEKSYFFYFDLFDLLIKNEKLSTKELQKHFFNFKMSFATGFQKKLKEFLEQTQRKTDTIFSLYEKKIEQNTFEQEFLGYSNIKELFSQTPNKDVYQHLFFNSFEDSLNFLRYLDCENLIKDKNVYHVFFHGFLKDKQIPFYKGKVTLSYITYLLGCDLIDDAQLENSKAYEFIKSIKFGLNYGLSSSVDLRYEQKIKNVNLYGCLTYIYNDRSIYQNDELLDFSHNTYEKFLIKTNKFYNEKFYQLLQSMANDFYWPGNQQSQYHIRQALKNYFLNYRFEGNLSIVSHVLVKNIKTDSEIEEKFLISIITVIQNLFSQEEKNLNLYFLNSKNIPQLAFYDFFYKIAIRQSFVNRYSVTQGKEQYSQMFKLHKKIDNIKPFFQHFIEKNLIKNDLSPEPAFNLLFKEYQNLPVAKSQMVKDFNEVMFYLIFTELDKAYKNFKKYDTYKENFTKIYQEIFKLKLSDNLKTKIEQYLFNQLISIPDKETIDISKKTYINKI